MASVGTGEIFLPVDEDEDYWRGRCDRGEVERSKGEGNGRAGERAVSAEYRGGGSGDAPEARTDECPTGEEGRDIPGADQPPGERSAGLPVLDAPEHRPGTRGDVRDPLRKQEGRGKPSRKGVVCLDWDVPHVAQAIEEHRRVYGDDPGRVIDQLIEEMSELIQALVHFRRGRGLKPLFSIRDEMADVLICLQLAEDIFDIGKASLELAVQRKCLRLIERLKGTGRSLPVAGKEDS